MIIKQVSVFVENHPGRLAEMLGVLRGENINIGALAIADGPDFGIVRMVFPEVERAVSVLRQAGFAVRVNDVLKAEVPDRPGGMLDAVARPLAEAGVNVEYAYAYVDQSPGRATVVIKVKDLAKAEQALKAANGK